MNIKEWVVMVQTIKRLSLKVIGGYVCINIIKLILSVLWDVCL